MPYFALPDADQIRRRRADRRSANRRRTHYMARIEAAPNGRQKINEAIDYLRAALARAPDELINQAVSELIAMADEAGDIA